jgi:tRNA(adenine34) deaminase
VSAPPLSAAEQAAMARALEEARAAAAAGEVPVGAVVLHGERLVAVARNRMRELGDATAHAELVALREAAQQLGEPYLGACTLVVTLEPCAMCAGAIVLSRVGKLLFGAWDPKAGMCGSVGDLVRHPRLNHSPQVRGGVLEAESGALLSAFFAERR